MVNSYSDVKSLIKAIETRPKHRSEVTLNSMNKMMELLHFPNKKFKSIHVTGTNGKGSTVSYLKHIYLENGLNVATFTSPYIISFNERIQYNNEFITDEDLLKIGNLVLKKESTLYTYNLPLLTFFEFITCIAFVYFSRIKKLDLAIIEVGMGGRLDATNVINPLCSIITNVDLEHTEVLGDTKELILKEKLGILKKDSHLITSINEPELVKIIKADAVSKKSSVNFIDKYSLELLQSTINYSKFNYKNYNNIIINLPGLFQVSNALCAIECVEVINTLNLHKKEFNVNSYHLYEGLKKTTWPGRLEIVSDNPLIYLDGGHNPACFKNVCDFISSCNDLKNQYKRAVVSISQDKNLKEMVSILDQTFDEIIFTTYTYSRSINGEELLKMSNIKNKKYLSNVDEAIEYVNNNQVDFTIYLGSLYLISEIRPKVLNKVL